LNRDGKERKPDRRKKSYKGGNYQSEEVRGDRRKEELQKTAHVRVICHACFSISNNQPRMEGILGIRRRGGTTALVQPAREDNGRSISKERENQSVNGKKKIELEENNHYENCPLDYGVGERKKRRLKVGK